MRLISFISHGAIICEFHLSTISLIAKIHIKYTDVLCIKARSYQIIKHFGMLKY